MLLSPLAERNWEDVCSVLEEALEDQSDRELFALELGSGTGQHVIHFARKIPFITWQPSDIKEEFLDSIRAYIVAAKVTNVRQPIHLDASEPWDKWAGLTHISCDVVVAINLMQYSSFTTAQGVFIGAGQILKEDGILIIYGAYAMNGMITPSCNEDLDAEIKKMNPEWGLPDIDVLRQLAFGNRLRMERIVSSSIAHDCPLICFYLCYSVCTY
ncbi:methyltransferase-like 26 B isoform X1 [Gadus chalcogrammus]|uniref:methyltransferase-like 26 B isoform X1 n=1 Tax=Gadus chalcogrammus TaxID=1042646 RepID=UPI0024C41086|nr:methyltransferase-like 26 B isoform X1 [Gadus chalcogrammus]